MNPSSLPEGVIEKSPDLYTEETDALRRQLEESKLKHAKLKRFLLELKANIDAAIDHV